MKDRQGFDKCFCEIASIQTGAGLSNYVLAVETFLKHIKANRNYDPNLDRDLCALQAAMKVRKKGAHKMQNNDMAHKHSLAMTEPEAQKSLPNMQELQLAYDALFPGIRQPQVRKSSKVILLPI